MASDVNDPVGLVIRRASPEDAGELHRLIVAIADYHDQVQSVRTSLEQLQQASQGKKFGALLAELDGKAVGYASYTFDYSIWFGRDYMRIDDVYVDADARGHGIGEALMQECRDVCEENGVPRIKWEVQTDNDGARRFYERLGARYYEKGVFAWDLAEPTGD